MLSDIPAAFHSLRRHPEFTLFAVLTLALGIGATTVVLSVTEAVLLRPLSYPEADRLVDVSNRTAGSPRVGVGGLDVVDLRQATGIFQDVAARHVSVSDLTLRTEGNQVAQASYLQVTYNYFRVLGVEAVVGRTFVPEDIETGPPADDPNDTPPPRAVVISYGLWQRALGGDPNLEGRSLDVAWTRFRVIGVLPPDFQLLHERRSRWVKGTSAEVFGPLTESALSAPGRRGGPGTRYYLALGRLQPGVSYAQAQAAMDVMAARLRAEYPAHETEKLEVLVNSLQQDLTEGTRSGVFVLLGGVAFLMLLVCANVANLQLVRGRVRAGEDAVRSALGCGRLRLFGQKLWESLLLALGGGVLGVGLAWAAIRVVEAMVPRTVPLMNRIEMNGWAVLFALGAALISVVLSGLLPAYYGSRLDLARELNRESRGSTARGRRRLMDLLVVGELALSMVLLSGAAVMVRTLTALSRTDLGFEPEGVVTFDLNTWGPKYWDDPGAYSVLYRRLEEELVAIPGVERVARTGMPPLGDAVNNATWGWSQEVFDRGTERCDVVYSTPDYFETMGTRLLAGRFFTEAENADPSSSVIVDAKLAGMAWPGEDPVGKQILFGSNAQQGVVVGVVESMLMRDFDAESLEAIHLPLGTNSPGAAATFVLRTRPGVDGLATSIRRAVQTVDPSLEPFQPRFLAERVSSSMGPTRFVLFLMGSFALVALVVAVVGLFGVIAFGVRTRTAEMGIRMALGAEPRGILSMVLGRAALLTLLGVAGGTGAALVLGRFLQAVTFGISPTEPLTLGAMALTLAVVSVLACLAPARWACRVDPVRALRGASH
ncbi:MAG TPA: ABC transporter permease [Longimicrobiales bacterium]|nr:ABC transporter permease [Longimicrobiales bacterium]